MTLSIYNADVNLEFIVFEYKRMRPRRTQFNTSRYLLQIYIDGPFGTSTREIFDTEHAVLIGGGVGITPYASILQSIMFRYLTMKRTCVKCDHVWYDDMKRELMKLKKVGPMVIV